MTHIPENARQADDPIEVRREADLARREEIADGLQRRHVAEAEYARLYAVHNFALALRLGKATKD